MRLPNSSQASSSLARLTHFLPAREMRPVWSRPAASRIASPERQTVRQRKQLSVGMVRRSDETLSRQRIRHRPGRRDVVLVIANPP